MLRSFVYRVARRAYMWARTDLANDPSLNGEYWLLDQFLRLNKRPVLALDIGANQGDWSAHFLEKSRNHGIHSNILLFEPSKFTFNALSNRFSSQGDVHLYNFAFSDTPGVATFYENGDGSGSNSLASAFGEAAATVQLQTIDGFLADQGITHVDFVKVDVEGFDANVIAGARSALALGQIDVLQFEYNWRWAVTGATLRSVFDRIEGTPYRVGKLAGQRLLMFEAWHMEMERFFEGNYVLLREGSPLHAIGTPAYYDASNVLKY